MVREYLFDIAKIVEGAVGHDMDKIVAFGEQLGNRLHAAGESEAAKRIRQIISKGQAANLRSAKASGGHAHELPVDSESRMPVADEEVFSTGQVKVVLPSDIQKTVDQFIDFYRAADELIANGVGVSATMLIYGPPGCGKTQLAKYVACELGMPLITARIDTLISSYLGSTAKNLRILFDYAASRPCVLFLDEFDALAKMRDDDKELGELKRVVISLLQNMDAIARDHVILAATNHEHLLDAAIWRRFSSRIQLPLPDLQSRAEMFKLFLGRYGNDDLVETLSYVTEGLPGSQVRDIADHAIRDAVVNQRKAILLRDAITFAAANHPKLTNAKTSEELWVALRDLNRKVFSQQRIAEIFNTTQSNVSKQLKRA